MRKAVIALVLALPFLAAASVPEPEGFRMDNYNAPVPATLAGAQVIGAKELSSAMEKGAIVIDVMPSPHRPATLPADRPWMPPPRMDVPGSLWWPEVGRGAISPALDSWFQARLKAATGGDTSKTVAFYCKADCWMSWNAAKRAIGYGYKQVLWFSGGAEAWAAAGFALHAGRPEPVPMD